MIYENSKPIWKIKPTLVIDLSITNKKMTCFQFQSRDEIFVRDHGFLSFC